jgi:hypothetical protein
MHNNRGTVGNSVLYSGPRRNVITEACLEASSVGTELPFREDLSPEVEE